VTNLCTICARGGSTGVVDKNIRVIRGKPLLVWSIEQAHQSGLFDTIAVSSDSAAILRVATDAGANVLIDRPPELATDTSAKVPAIRHCVTSVEERLGRRFDVVVDLDATSPLRKPADIVAAVALLEARHAPNVITGSPARRSPYFNLVERDPTGSVKLAKAITPSVVRRQDAPPCFDMNASIYVWRRNALFEDPALFKAGTVLYEMPPERSVDIDSELDFRIVDMIMSERDA